MTTDPSMTIITAEIKPNMEAVVIRALHDLPEFPGFSITEVRGQGRGRGVGGAYRATDYDFTFLRHLQIQIVCRSDAADLICDTIAKAAWTGRKGDGVIFMSPATSFARIREVGHGTSKVTV